VKETVSTVLEIVGFAAISAAAFLVTVTLGLLVAGASCIAIGYLIGRKQ
jgi:hypothetical protein